MAGEGCSNTLSCPAVPPVVDRQSVSFSLRLQRFPSLSISPSVFSSRKNEAEGGEALVVNRPPAAGCPGTEGVVERSSVFWWGDTQRDTLGLHGEKVIMGGKERVKRTKISKIWGDNEVTEPIYSKGK